MATNNSNPVQIPNIRDYFRKNKDRIAREIGNEAVRHFKDNFRQEGFVDNGIHKWKEVKRRDPSSRWYEFAVICFQISIFEPLKTAVTTYSPARSCCDLLSN